MLNIPEIIKGLYKLDGVRKNFRASFPNGERADITNSDVVKESLVFTESVSSQEVFRFGLAEASQIEFETVGIGNIYGMTIDCFIEIDTSSLSSAQRDEIRANPGDGSLPLARLFYSIALGRFQVMSCPRDSKEHRKITAYGGAGYWLTRKDAVEQAKLTAIGRSESLKLNARNYTLAKMASSSESVLTENNLTKTQIATYSNFVDLGTTRRIRASLSIQGSTSTVDLLVRSSGYNIGNTDAIHAVENADMWIVRPDIVEAIEDYAAAQGITFDSGSRTQHDYIASKVNAVCGPIIYYYTGAGGATQPGFARIGNNAPGLYAYGRQEQYGAAYIAVPETITLARTTASVMVTIETFTRDNLPLEEQPIIYRWDKADASILDALEDLDMSFEPTDTIDETYNSFSDAYDPRDIVNGFLELGAYFAQANRSVTNLGGMRLMRLAITSPQEISSEDIDELWWDEYDVEAIGTVLYSYKASDGSRKESQYSFSSDSSIYDMRDNAVIDALEDTAFAHVANLIGTVFRPYIRSVAFTPIELTMPAWPWLEAGDFLEFDGIYSYMLQREMSGIQLLMDDVTAKGGEIIEGGAV